MSTFSLSLRGSRLSFTKNTSAERCMMNRMSRWLPIAVCLLAVACSNKNDSTTGAAGNAGSGPLVAKNEASHVGARDSKELLDGGVSTIQSSQAESLSATSSPTASVERVVLVTVDTLRADQPWVGYEYGSTPVLSKLAESAVVYTRAYTVANTTGPSLSSLLAARYPTELERDNCPLAGFDVGDGLAHVLSEAGVWTAAAHGHAYFVGVSAPKKGFVDWRTIDNAGGRLVTEGAITGPAVTDLAIRLFQEAPANKSAFIWAHYLEPHDSYVLHKDFPPSKHPRRGAYDGEVAFVDNEIGRLLAAIEASDKRDSTAIIITSDHGEAFGEHERYRHGYTVFEEEINVPLLIRIPSQNPRRIETPRSTIDIPRTIASLLGATAPSRWRGRSLVEDLSDSTIEERPVIVDAPELMNLPAQQSVILGKRKVVRLGTRWTAYDLESDPAEKKPIQSENAREWIEQAKSVLAAIESIPHRACARQAYK